MAYCSWTNSHKLFRSFWSIFIPRSGIYAEKWYPGKRHVPHRFIWKCPPGSLAFYLKKVKISKIVQNRQTDRVNFPSLKSHIICLTCWSAWTSLYLKNQTNQYFVPHPLFDCLSTLFFIVCPRRTCHDQLYPIVWDNATRNQLTWVQSTAKGVNGLCSAVPWWCNIVFWAGQFSYQLLKVWIDIS